MVWSLHNKEAGATFKILSVKVSGHSESQTPSGEYTKHGAGYTDIQFWGSIYVITEFF